MNWYYVDQGQQAGPVDDSQLDQLRASGKIQPDTLIWREGMANWAPYSQAREGAAPPPGSAPATDAAGRPQATCTQCGGVFPVEDMIRYGSAHVCAGCKPAFVQKLAEGAQIQPTLEYASIWARFAAMILDGIILWIVGTAVQFGLGFVVTASTNPADAAFLIFQLALIGVQMLLALSYETWMVGAYGATLGKMACKIKVVTAEGEKVSYARACGRYFAKILSQLICLIGYLMAVFDKEERRALHDRICNTRVVVK